MCEQPPAAEIQLKLPIPREQIQSMDSRLLTPTLNHVEEIERESLGTEGPLQTNSLTLICQPPMEEVKSAREGGMFTVFNSVFLKTDLVFLILETPLRDEVGI